MQSVSTSEKLSIASETLEQSSGGFLIVEGGDENDKRDPPHAREHPSFSVGGHDL